MLRVYAQCADAHCPPLSRPHNLHYVGNARRTGLIAPRGRRCAGASIAKADKNISGHIYRACAAIGSTP
jgi:hypothetical protein